MNLYTGATLKNLIDTLGPVKKADRTPTSRKLREEAGEPIITTDSIMIYGDQEAFEQDYKKLVGQHERLVSRIEKAEAEKKDRKDRARKIELYMGLLERQDEELDFDAVLFALFVDKVIVSGTKRDVHLRFVLADGSEWEA